MVEAGKKVNFYRLALRRGKMHRMSLSEDDRLVGEGGGVFGYLAPMFDSKDYEGTWHRFRLEGMFSSCKYEVIAAATDENLEELLGDENLGFSDCLSILKDRGHVRKVNTEDLLLHSLQGRYLWIALVVTGAKLDSKFKIEGFSVEFPHSSFVEYLPEIYQEEGRDSFFERYMAVLQSLYEDLEKEVDLVPTYLDYETTPEENLPLFAEWTGRWNRGHSWTPQQMRDLIGGLSRIQTGRGTRSVMEEMVYFMTGKKPMIIEHFQWKEWLEKEGALLEECYQAYGNDEDIFAVVFRCSEQEVGISRTMLEKKLDDYTPLGMKCKVVYLKKSDHLDGQLYLDQNSYLSAPEKSKTEGFILDK